MKSVAPHAGSGDGWRQRKGLRHLCLDAMKCRVEAGHLEQVRTKLCDDVDGLEVVGLMQRCERGELSERGNHLGGDQHSFGKPHPTVHDAMADRHELVVPTMVPQ